MILTPLKSQRGVLTLDFLFAFVLIMGFSTILFALSLTLTVAEITQYVTYAAARNYAPAHVSEERQRQMATLKYRELLTHSELQPFYVNGWFQVDAEPDVGDITKIFPEYAGDGAVTNNFIGAGTTFIARMLEFNVPFYGSTASDGDGAGGGFKTYLASYLGREVSTNECLQFMQQRWSYIRNLPATAGAQPYSVAPNQGYVSYEDNGC